jgi:hypothetical protein
MLYTKPEVSILGNASAVIEQINPPRKGTTPGDGPVGAVLTPPAAYDLDE